ncbi:MAG: hypothetical protein OXH03_10135 [Bacteroidetes bacterium]|nr:hypothetical protein [Bacteroidota bacterium]MXW82199.1 hypothetical protein [Rhodothermaceae bacterium]MDE2673378.1 hypothetical protein [Bacteroidota bacterium]MXX58449.1 hypothetical protein [Rhodothermaceae bacterium]MYD20239.1 hypothetical protein [Rhodothermaceae bacterium]
MSEYRTAERRFTTMKKGGRVYNWIHFIGFIPIAFLTTEFGSLAVSSDGPGIGLAPVEEIAIFVLGIAAFLAWDKYFPKFTGGNVRKINPSRRSSIGVNG